MRIKTYAICMYIILIYWVSLHIPHLNSLFFPTLGAFSLLFISRPFLQSEIRKIALGAIISSIIGSLAAYMHTGVLSLLLTLIIVIGFIHKFKWNAPPILAVALIPFFTQPQVAWAIPLSVAAALAGLLMTLSLAAYCDKSLKFLPAFFKKIVKAESDTSM